MTLALIDGFNDFISTAQSAVNNIKAIFELFISILDLVINFFPSPFKEILLLFSVAFTGIVIFKIIGAFLW